MVTNEQPLRYSHSSSSHSNSDGSRSANVWNVYVEDYSHAMPTRGPTLFLSTELVRQIYFYAQLIRLTAKLRNKLRIGQSAQIRLLHLLLPIQS